MREIVLDTETTGLDPGRGHRVVEIGCVELMNQIPTGREFQKYVNPEREMPEAAFRVHGLSSEFLAGHPTFGEIVEGFLEFVGDAHLVIHNAAFDLGFLNAEFKRLGLAELSTDRAVDTVGLARKRFPGAQANLDALCRRFNISIEARKDAHGALLDAKLLADVYLELLGGRQPGLVLDTVAVPTAAAANPAPSKARPRRPHPPIDAEELARHEAMVAKLKKPIWKA